MRGDDHGHARGIRGHRMQVPPDGSEFGLAGPASSDPDVHESCGRGDGARDQQRVHDVER
jgi:hypothetical protein